MKILPYLLTVLWITIKRILRNWRTVGALLIGLILATGIMASIPIYSSASLQKSFIRSWIEQATTRPPFAIILTHRNERRRYNIGAERLDKLSQFVEKSLPRSVRLEPEIFSSFGRIGSDPFLKDPEGVPDFRSPRTDLSFLSNLQDLGQIVDGRWYESRDDAVVEVVADEATFQRLELIVGGRYTFHYRAYENEDAGVGREHVPVQVEVVGLFRARENNSMRDWIYPPPFLNRLFVHPEMFRKTLQGSMKLRVDGYDYFAVFPYRKVRVNRLDTLSRALRAFEERAERIGFQAEIWFSPLTFFDSFHKKMQSISFFLTGLAIPALGMVLYYVILMAGVAVENRRAEMAVLQSRGAGRFQVMTSFFIEWMILGLFAMTAGPFIGLWITRIMGSSTGFLAFVNRTALPVKLNGEAFLFSLIASAVAMIAATLPVFGSFRHSIVTYRVHQARGLRRSIWHRYYFDFILVGLAIFGHRSLSWEQVFLTRDAPIQADPILFFVPVVGLLGFGLLLLRIYPLLMRGLAKLTEKLRGVVWQLVLRRLQRNASQYLPILVLLILTISLAIYTATAARTLSTNFEDQISYHIGADLVIDEQWEETQEGGPPGASPQIPLGEVSAEPPLLVREEIEGVIAVARVLRESATIKAGTTHLGIAHMMAIAPHEFARVAWYRNDLFDAHFKKYLELMNRHREGIIISRSILKRGELELGSAVSVRYQDEEFDTYVAAVVDYWPGIDPRDGLFFIANLAYVQDRAPLQPYHGWYKVSEDMELQTLVSRLTSQGIYPEDIVDARSELTKLRREPYRMGFYGILSMSFIVSSLITVLGFLIYTFYSIRSRLIQFGALRANGLSPGQLIAVVCLEQLATLGTGLGLGFALGRITNLLFIPFLRDRAGGLKPVPPFLVVTRMSDFYLVLLVIALIFVGAVLTLSLLLIRKRLFASLRLGEEG